jgi:hypothetical protein
MSTTIHPSPAEMARRSSRVFSGWDKHVYAMGVEAERRRMAAILLDRAQAAHARAVALRNATTTPDDDAAWGRAMGEAETLAALAAELIP